MHTIWFTADTHFGHKNILEFSKRPFASVAEMDEAMVQRWNEKVGPEDLVYHLGDVALLPPTKLRPLLDRLNGRICLITGNHESAALACADRFDWIKPYHELTLDDPDASRGKRTSCYFTTPSACGMPATTAPGTSTATRTATCPTMKPRCPSTWE